MLGQLQALQGLVDQVAQHLDGVLETLRQRHRHVGQNDLAVDALEGVQGAQDFQAGAADGGAAAALVLGVRRQRHLDGARHQQLALEGHHQHAVVLAEHHQGMGLAIFLAQGADVAQGGLRHLDGRPDHALVGGFGVQLQGLLVRAHQHDAGVAGAQLGRFRHGQQLQHGVIDGVFDQVGQLPAQGLGPLFAGHVGGLGGRQAVLPTVQHQGCGRHAAFPLPLQHVDHVRLGVCVLGEQAAEHGQAVLGRFHGRIGHERTRSGGPNHVCAFDPFPFEKHSGSNVWPCNALKKPFHQVEG